MNDHISDQMHLACDLKWPHVATRGIVIFPMMQPLHFSKSLFTGVTSHMISFQESIFKEDKLHA